VKLPASLPTTYEYHLKMQSATATDYSAMRFNLSIALGNIDWTENDGVSTSGHTGCSGGAWPTDGAWHHICATSEGTASGTRKIYLDGSLMNTTTNGIALSASPDDLVLYVAVQPHNLGVLHSLCNLDEVAIYGAELSLSDVESLYNSGVPAAPSATNLLNHLRMGDGPTDTTSVIYDQVGSLNINLTNGPTLDTGHPYKNEAPTL
jgi:hypothetical protein